MIQLSNICKKYPDGKNSFHHVLQGLNLEVKKGEFIAIKGASGSGKTTLLSILGTLQTPDSGSYLFNGIEINTPDVDYSTLRNQKIGFVFQDHRLLPQLTALENILLPTLALQQKSDISQVDYARKLMEMTGIISVSHQYPATLSGGEANRVSLCRALIMKPLVVLADEPTGQLDAYNARKTVRLLSQINKELETTLVMVTHSDETAAVANRILTLSEMVLG